MSQFKMTLKTQLSLNIEYRVLYWDMHYYILSSHKFRVTSVFQNQITEIKDYRSDSS